MVRTGRLTQEVEKLRGEIVRLVDEIAKLNNVSGRLDEVAGELAGLRGEVRRLASAVEALDEDVKVHRRYLLLAILVYVAFWSATVAVIYLAHRFLFGG